MGSIDLLDAQACASTERLLGLPLYGETQPERTSTLRQRTQLGRLALALADKISMTERRASLRSTVEPLVARLAMFNHLDASEQGYLRTLRKHQYSPYEKTVKFVSDIPEVDPLPDNERALLNLLTRTGYVKLATGYGKTVLMSVLAREIGIGEPIPGLQKPKRFRALIVVPTLTIMKQTIGQKGKRGFAEFAPEINITAGDSKNQDFSGDAVVVTYKGLLSMAENRPEMLDEFQTIFLDEAHFAHGERASEVIQELLPGRIVIGFTATPDQSEERQLKNILPYEIDNISLRESIENGILRKARFHAFATGQVVAGKLRRGELTEESIKPLRENEQRNELIQNLVKSMVEDGRQGVVSCIRGEDLCHATTLAEALDGQMIYDKTLGRMRPLVAKVVKGNDNQSENALERFEMDELGKEGSEKSRVDVLFFVDKLTQGWDSQHVGFVIAAAPTTSATKMEQLIGRGTRPGLYDDTIYIQLIDLFAGSVRPVTMFGVMGEDIITQGLMIGGVQTQSDTKGKTKDGPPGKSGVRHDTGGGSSGAKKPERGIFTRLTEEQLETYQNLQGVLLEELVIEGGAVAKAPKGWVPLSICGAHLDLTRTGLVNVVDSFGAGREKGDYRLNVLTHGYYEIYIEPGIAARLVRYKLPDVAPPDYLHYPAAISALGMSRHRLEAVVAELEEKEGFELGEYRERSQARRVLPHFSPKQIERIKQYRQAEQKSQGLTPLRLLEERFGFHYTNIASYLASLGFEAIKQRTQEGGTDRTVRCYNDAAVAAAEKYFNKPMPADGVKVPDFCAEVKMSQEKFSSYISQHGYTAMIQTARYKDKQTGRGVREAFLPKAFADYLRKEVEEAPPPPSEDYTPEVVPKTTKERATAQRADRSVALQEFTFEEIFSTLPQCDLAGVSQDELRRTINDLAYGKNIPGVYKVRRSRERGAQVYAVEFVLSVIIELRRQRKGKSKAGT